MADDPDYYFKNKKVINFNIIHNQCCEDPLKKSIKQYKTVYNNDLKNYLKNENKSFLCNISN